MTENDAIALLDRLAADLRPPPPPLAEAASSGRQRVLRRRGLVGLAGCAAVAVVLAGVLAWPRDDGHTQPAAAHGLPGQVPTVTQLEGTWRPVLLDGTSLPTPIGHGQMLLSVRFWQPLHNDSGGDRVWVGGYDGCNWFSSGTQPATLSSRGILTFGLTSTQVGCLAPRSHSHPSLADILDARQAMRLVDGRLELFRADDSRLAAFVRVPGR
jgi:hypothetical protein